MTPPRLVLVAALLTVPSLAAADEPTGCSAFRWPIERERTALAAATKLPVANGGALSYGAALALRLAPFAEASLPQAPERGPRFAPSYAGHFTLAAPSRPGIYKLTLTLEGWIDVVDNGAFLRPKGFSGAIGCEGARKSVKFDLPGRPVEVQVSGVRDAEIALIVTPAE